RPFTWHRVQLTGLNTFTARHGVLIFFRSHATVEMTGACDLLIYIFRLGAADDDHTARAGPPPAFVSRLPRVERLAHPHPIDDPVALLLLEFADVDEPDLLDLAGQRGPVALALDLALEDHLLDRLLRDQPGPRRLERELTEVLREPHSLPGLLAELADRAVLGPLAVLEVPAGQRPVREVSAAHRQNLTVVVHRQDGHPSADDLPQFQDRGARLEQRGARPDVDQGDEPLLPGVLRVTCAPQRNDRIRRPGVPQLPVEPPPGVPCGPVDPRVPA